MKKKLLALLLGAVMTMSLLAACGKAEPTESISSETSESEETAAPEETEETEETEAKEEGVTILSEVQNTFIAKAGEGASLADVAQAIAECESIPTKVASVQVTPGYLNGFDEEIDGFQDGYMISPIINAIPLVIYVFEVESGTEVEYSKYLTEASNMAWNVCTVADETLVSISGNYVFFAMGPYNLD